MLCKQIILGLCIFSINVVDGAGGGGGGLCQLDLLEYKIFYC